jgi:hypothetical protein
MGAIMGGTASLIAASNDGEDIAGVVTLSAPATFSGLSVGAYQLERIFGAKLFIAGAADAQGAASAQQFYDDTLEPKRVEIIPTADQGTDILSGNQGGIVENMIEDWLTQYSKATSS